MTLKFLTFCREKSILYIIYRRFLQLETLFNEFCVHRPVNVRFRIEKKMDEIFFSLSFVQQIIWLCVRYWLQTNRTKTFQLCIGRTEISRKKSIGKIPRNFFLFSERILNSAYQIWDSHWFSNDSVCHIRRILKIYANIFQNAEENNRFTNDICVMGVCTLVVAL